MRIKTMRIYEGNNIKRQKRVFKVCLEEASHKEITKLLSGYFRISFLLGFREKLVSLNTDKDTTEIWVTYSEEEVSKFIVKNIVYGREEAEQIADRASRLVKEGLVYSIVKKWRSMDMPVIEISEDMFQLGYGKNSLLLSRDYQSYENMTEIIKTRNRKNLDNTLRFNQIPTVEGTVYYSFEEVMQECRDNYPISINSLEKPMDINIVIMSEEELKRVIDNMMKMYSRVFVYSGKVDYKIVCYKGEAGLIFKNEKGYKKIDIDCSKLEVLEVIEVVERLKTFCKKVYDSIRIELMYIDIQEDGGFKVVDLGSVFDIQEEVKDIEEEIVDYFTDCMKAEGIGLIPIIAVTGTNGKTTTSRLIYHTLNKLGVKTGLTSTGGIFVGGKKIKSGDTTGFVSARDVLANKDVEAAVMETARGGIYRNGLGYERAKAAVFTSISEDHIGMEGVKCIEDLVNIKSVVLDELDYGGKIIIKSQKELIEICRNRKNVCLISLAKDKFIAEHIKNNNEALYVDEDTIFWFKNGVTRNLIRTRDIPFAHHGNSNTNILNVLAAVAAIDSLGFNHKDIISCILQLECNLEFNPGRQNILDFKDFKVILDYGHNSEAFNEVLNIAKALKPSRLTSIIAAAGDRMDKYIKELGQIAAKYSDYIIIREQADLRGRAPGESAALIRQGVLESGFNKENIKVILKEEEAIVHAMGEAWKGEVIVLFTQCLDVIVPAINGYLDGVGREKVGEGMEFSH